MKRHRLQKSQNTKKYCNLHRGRRKAAHDVMLKAEEAKKTNKEASPSSKSSPMAASFPAKGLSTEN